MIWPKFRNNTLLFVCTVLFSPISISDLFQFSVTYVNPCEFRRRCVGHAVHQLAIGIEQLSKTRFCFGANHRALQIGECSR